MRVFYQSSGVFGDPVASRLIQTLKNIYSDEIYLSFCNNFAPNVYLLSEKIKQAESVFIWNGSEAGCFWVIEICESFNIPYCVFERGLFPQSDSNFMVDMKGISCRSESIRERYLNKSELPNNFRTIAKHYSDREITRKPPKEKYVFVFQLEFDSTVYHYSSYNSNEEMVDQFIASNDIDPSTVVVCPHPRNKGITSKYKISNRNTIKECEDACVAIGISSTVMYEILGMGCPVKVLGGNVKMVHPINREWSSKELIIPCILQNQFDSSDPEEQIFEKIQRNMRIK